MNRILGMGKQAPLALSLAVAILLLAALATLLAQTATAHEPTPDAGRHSYVWQTANTGLTNLSVRSMARDPVVTSTLYVETERGGFKSTDNGRSWFLIRNNDPYYTWGMDMVFAPDDHDTLYLADLSMGVLKSTNGGATWTPKNSGLTGTSIRTLEIAATPPYTLFAGLSDQYSVAGGVFRSTDGGDNWTLLGFEEEPIHAIAAHPVTPGLIYVGTWSGLVMSYDGGDHWTAHHPDITSDVTAFAIDPHQPNVVYAGTWGAGVFKTVDGGENWEPVGGWSISELVIDPAWPHPIYAAAAESVSASWDGGLTWEDLACPGGYMSAIILDGERPGGGVLVGAFDVYGPPGVYRGTWLRYSQYLPVVSRE